MGRESRIAMVSVHTSPLLQPGRGDAGGMNVYVTELARAMGRLGASVDIFTRRTSSTEPAVVDVASGVVVRHVDAGPYGKIPKGDLPALMCSFAAAMLRHEVAQRPHWYDVVHSHYWLSALPGLLTAERWGVPLVHTMHTLAKGKNAALAPGDRPEPSARVRGEQQIADEADRLIASTPNEATHLSDLYGADPAKISVIAPGVNIDEFQPGLVQHLDQWRQLGVDPTRPVVLYAGRIQRLKGTEVLIRAWERFADLPRDTNRPQLVIVGDSSGGDDRVRLQKLVRERGLTADVVWLDPVPQESLADLFRLADLVAVPSYYETFGLVAIEAQACGTPVIAARVGGLATVVRDGITGRLVDSHDPDQWAADIEALLRDRVALGLMSEAAVQHAQAYSWKITARRTLNAYAKSAVRLQTNAS